MRAWGGVPTAGRPRSPPLPFPLHPSMSTGAGGRPGLPPLQRRKAEGQDAQLRPRTAVSCARVTGAECHPPPSPRTRPDTARACWAGRAAVQAQTAGSGPAFLHISRPVQRRSDAPMEGRVGTLASDGKGRVAGVPLVGAASAAHGDGTAAPSATSCPAGRGRDWIAVRGQRSCPRPLNRRRGWAATSSLARWGCGGERG